MAKRKRIKDLERAYNRGVLQKFTNSLLIFDAGVLYTTRVKRVNGGRELHMHPICPHEGVYFPLGHELAAIADGYSDDQAAQFFLRMEENWPFPDPPEVLWERLGVSPPDEDAQYLTRTMFMEQYVASWAWSANGSPTFSVCDEVFQTVSSFDFTTVPPAFQQVPFGSFLLELPGQRWDRAFVSQWNIDGTSSVDVHLWSTTDGEYRMYPSRRTKREDAFWTDDEPFRNEHEEKAMNFVRNMGAYLFSLSDTEEVDLDPPVRRRPKRKERPHKRINLTSVVSIRPRPSRESKSVPDSGRRVGVRYVVRPHWRHYKPGPGKPWKEERLVLIDKQVRGPADAPMTKRTYKL